MQSTIILLVLFGAIMYFLYMNGHMTINAKRAVTFIGSIRGRGKCSASFHSCSGYMKRIIRFRESRSYHFELETELVGGELSVEILDSEKKTIMKLSVGSPAAEVEVESGKRYTLIFRFTSASGSYQMHWN